MSICETCVIDHTFHCFSSIHDTQYLKLALLFLATLTTLEQTFKYTASSQCYWIGKHFEVGRAVAVLKHFGPVF